MGLIYDVAEKGEVGGGGEKNFSSICLYLSFSLCLKAWLGRRERWGVGGLNHNCHVVYWPASRPVPPARWVVVVLVINHANTAFDSTRLPHQSPVMRCVVQSDFPCALLSDMAASWPRVRVPPLCER